MSPLSEKALLMLDDLQPELADDQHVQGTLAPLAIELDRVEVAAAGILARLFPQHADDAYLTLSMLEGLYGLPIAPPGATVGDRRNAVLASVRQRTGASGAAWVELITTLLGSPVWSHEEGPAASTITLHVPYSSGTYVTTQLARIARRVTPAHLAIGVGFDEGFLIGVSLVGEVL